MRKTLCASALVLTLCGSALAGDVSTPPVAPTPPPSSSQTYSTQANEESGGTGATYDPSGGILNGDGLEALTEAALNMLDRVLTLF